MLNSQVNRPLLSIIIPTFNRIPYAISAINSILSIDSSKLELVIQDNSETLGLKEHIEANVTDSRLIYQHISKRLSIVDNFNEGMEISTGEYVCFIGDDDGVNPEIIEAAMWAKNNDLDSLSIRQTAHYLWPDTGLKSTAFTNVVGGNLSIKQFSSEIVEINLEEELKKLMKNGGLYYLDYDMPKVYHGIARRECFNLIKEKTGGYFGGASPDMFSSIALACVSKKAAIVEYPLTIPGHCSVAEVTHHIEKAHLRPMENAPHFKGRGEYKWSPLVPFIFIGEAFWVDAGVAALKAMERDDLIQELNVPKLCAYCAAGYSGLMKLTLTHLLKVFKLQKKNVFFGGGQFLLGLITGPFLRFTKRVWNRLMLILKVTKKIELNGVEDMTDCSIKLSKFLTENDFSFSSCKVRKL